MKIFFDNCTPPRLAAALDGFIRDEGGAASHIRDLPCGPHAADVEWIRFLARDEADWIVITGDDRIRRNPAERAAWRSAGLLGFVFSRGLQKMKVHQCASLLFWRWPEIENVSRLIEPPALYELPVSRNAKLRQLPF